jgi:hypothetical protein
MEALGTGLEGKSASAYVFAPMRKSYRQRLYSPAANEIHGGGAGLAFDPKAFKASLHTKDYVNKSDLTKTTDAGIIGGAVQEDKQVQKKEKGGKLASSDEIYDLLFK